MRKNLIIYFSKQIWRCDIKNIRSHSGISEFDNDSGWPFVVFPIENTMQ